MSFRSIVRDVRDGFGSLSRRSFEVTLASIYGLTGHHKGKTQSSSHELDDSPSLIRESRWASLPPELIRDIIRRLEADESTWPARKHVVCFAAVCRTWREMCKEIVLSPEFCGKLTFPVSLKQVKAKAIHLLQLRVTLIWGLFRISSKPWEQLVYFLPWYNICFFDSLVLEKEIQWFNVL